MGVTFYDTGLVKTNPNHYVVCAGTKHLWNVGQMGAGFNVFKQMFGYNENSQVPWAQQLNRILQTGPENAPAFMDVEYGNNKGGIASVPRYDARIDQDADYKKAVREAIEGARKANKKDLSIQPLGIGLYGWDPERAATLFHEAIEADKKANPGNPVDIHIPIHQDRDNPEQNEKNQAFQDELTRLQQAPAQTMASAMTPPPSTRTSTYPTPHQPPTSTTAAVQSPPSVMDSLVKNFATYLQACLTKAKITENQVTSRLTNAQNNQRFEFNNQTDAKQFLTEQAQNKLAFSASMTDAQGKQTHFVSCGTGRLYEGDKEQILMAMRQDLANEQDTTIAQKLKEGIQHFSAQQDTNATHDVIGHGTQEAAAAAAAGTMTPLDDNNGHGREEAEAHQSNPTPS